MSEKENGFWLSNFVPIESEIPPPLKEDWISACELSFARMRMKMRMMIRWVGLRRGVFWADWCHWGYQLFFSFGWDWDVCIIPFYFPDLSVCLKKREFYHCDRKFTIVIRDILARYVRFWCRRSVSRNTSITSAANEIIRCEVDRFCQFLPP